ncbi:uncharacterized protein A4U43_C05F3090 [Asparagus officinalis]|uniref:Uncharacterized protein n=1 Tax=Asparagus officinalis TaxID=4686 RepID=A0A5P1EPK5_ASPOF|nr:uncharacterized protein A4U43_C05F3090 [Asparagus officinalis]
MSCELQDERGRPVPRPLVPPSLPRTRRPTPPSSSPLSSAAVLVLAAAVRRRLLLFYRIKNADVIEPWEFEYGPPPSPTRAQKGHRGSGPGSCRRRAGSQGLQGDPARIRTESRQAGRNGSKARDPRVRSGDRQHSPGLATGTSSASRAGAPAGRPPPWSTDYMPNGSLDRPSSRQRSNGSSRGPALPILKNVASALLYLHEEWSTWSFTGTSRRSNVLLDADLSGRLGISAGEALRARGPTRARRVLWARSVPAWRLN